jgi:uncharacterized protein
MLNVMKSPGDNGPATWFLFAHGAGAPSSSPWMQHYAKLLSQFGQVRSFDYPYMREGKKRPDPAPKLLATHREELHSGIQKLGPRVVLAGKSMGGRMSCHLALQEEVLGVICFGYPLQAMGSGTLRDQVLRDLQVPACFIQGTRDALCPLDLLQTVLEKRSAPSFLHVVQTGDHSLTPTKGYLKAAGITLEDQEAATMTAIGTFLSTF